jgi:hemin uptake protein HemP
MRMTEEEAGEPTAATRAGPPVPEGMRVVPSEQLLMGSREIVIRHGSEDYRLRLTRAGKLILNK